ncbi:MAG: hypothetical protein HC835_08125 [Oscillatoriales cyanobacterium RM2_1_1]|nr:hypothetical protein [Oscillatoriales cyanobacterium SM2_3_0]NJO45591.1 hypothetical protein [Oscillatoriales cyanobacterium RM2_1_1]
MYFKYEALECPKCTRHSLVQRDENVYACINCDFKKDFARPLIQPAKNSRSSVVELVAMLAGALVLLVLL